MDSDDWDKGPPSRGNDSTSDGILPPGASLQVGTVAVSAGQGITSSSLEQSGSVSHSAASDGSWTSSPRRAECNAIVV